VRSITIIAHAAIGRIGRPASLRPLIGEGKENTSKARAHRAARSRRHSLTSLRAKRVRATRWLAMTLMLLFEILNPSHPRAVIIRHRVRHIGRLMTYLETSLARRLSRSATNSEMMPDNQNAAIANSPSHAQFACCAKMRVSKASERPTAERHAATTRR
jgi:hypothetical protein